MPAASSAPGRARRGSAAAPGPRPGRRGPARAASAAPARASDVPPRTPRSPPRSPQSRATHRPVPPVGARRPQPSHGPARPARAACATPAPRRSAYQRRSSAAAAARTRPPDAAPRVTEHGVGDDPEQQPGGASRRERDHPADATTRGTALRRRGRCRSPASGSARAPAAPASRSGAGCTATSRPEPVELRHALQRPSRSGTCAREQPPPHPRHLGHHLGHRDGRSAVVVLLLHVAPSHRMLGRHRAAGARRSVHCRRRCSRCPIPRVRTTHA